MPSPNNPSSQLLPIIKALTGKLRGNPEGLIEKMLPPKQKQLYTIAKPLMKQFGFSPASLIDGGLQKLDALPEEFWIQIEQLARGVLDGDEEATAKLCELLGVTYEGIH